jgi:YHS domain-containing protein
MKKIIVALALSTALGACSAQTDAPDASSTDSAVEAVQAANVIADLGGENSGPVYTEVAGETLALSGYDAVSYFTGDAPVVGSAEFTVKYEGYDYQFASAENAATFQEDPAKYAPQYGGYCAWAIGANDALAPGDPNVYKIVDGKLYLNFSEAVAERWNKDIPGFIEKADVNYPTHAPDEHYTTN